MQIEQIDRDAAAKALGYATWEDATDYRNSGAEDRRVAHMVQAFAAHRLAALSARPALPEQPTDEVLKALCQAIENTEPLPPMPDEEYPYGGACWQNEAKAVYQVMRAMIAARPADSDMVERVARAIMSSAHTFPEQAKVYMGYGQATHAARAAIAAITGESAV